MVALAAGVGFYLYRRRLKRRYTSLADPYPSPGIVHRPGNITSASASSLATHRSYPSDSSSSRPALKRKQSKVSVAWEQAKMQGPRKLGGLLSDRAKVHARTKNANWSIDDSEQGHESLPPASSGHSKETSGESYGLSTSQPSQAPGSQTSLVSSLARLARHGRSESQVGLLSSPEQTPSSPPLRPSRDLPSHSNPSPNPISRLVSSVAGHFREPPVPVVNGAPRRGFNMDDVDAQSPTSAYGRRSSDSYVNIGEGEVQQLRQDMYGTPISGRRFPNLSLPVRQLSPIPSRHDSEGAESTDAVVNGGREVGRFGGIVGRARNDSGSVMLISSRPGQDFNSMASPIVPEPEADALGPFYTAPTEASISVRDLSSRLNIELRL